jgi:endo-1,4-beta-xylanase
MGSRYSSSTARRYHNARHGSGAPINSAGPALAILVALVFGCSSKPAAVIDAAASPPDADPSEGGSAASGDTGASATKFVGNITTRRQVRSDFAQYWNQITPENEGKWGSVEPSEGTFNWSSLDTIYKFAHDNDVVFKEHCFVWGAQQPTWVNSDNGNAAVKNWIQSFCQRYPETPFIDVVNEPPPHTTPAYKDGIGGDGASGWDWIVNAFKWAHEACPSAILILNDYDNAENAGTAQHTIDIVSAIKKAGAPIDAVGCQAHGAYTVATATLKANIDKIALETGLPVYITEYDINLADDEQQKAVMQDQFTMFWNNTNIKGITLWGYIYGQTWMTNTGLMQSDGTMRSAMAWLQSFLGRQ